MDAMLANLLVDVAVVQLVCKEFQVDLHCLESGPTKDEYESCQLDSLASDSLPSQPQIGVQIV